MACVRSRGNKSTELKFIALLKYNRIKGWRRKFKVVGNPDITFPKGKIAVFIDGCFWHGCSQHLRLPSTNIDYWQTKIEKNMSRDKTTNRALKKNGWRIFRFWEHELRHFDKRCEKKLKIIAELAK